MDRRRFLTTAGTGAIAATAALSKPAIAQGLRNIRLVTTWPRDFPGLGVGADRIAKRITALSEGRLNVQLHAAGELVSAFDSFDAVASGDAEMYHGVEYYWESKHKAFVFFGSVPLGMTAHEIEAWVHFGGGQQLWDELSGQFGIKSLLAGNTGVQMGGWYQEPIKSIEQIGTLKMRIPGLGGEVIRRLGGEAVSLPGGKIVEALKSGQISATEWVGPYNDLAFGLQEILKNYMFPGFHEPGTALSLGINRAFWDSLTDTEREIIRAAASAENDIMMAEFNARNGEALQELTTTHGVKLHIFPRDVWTAIAKVSQDVVGEVGQVDALGERILSSWRSFQRKVSEWQQISDISYTAFRSITVRG